MRLSYLTESRSLNTINMMAHQLKQRFESAGARQVEVEMAQLEGDEATVTADIGEHVLIDNDVVIRITQPNEFLVNIPVTFARIIGIREALTVHDIKTLNAVIERIIKASK